MIRPWKGSITILFILAVVVTAGMTHPSQAAITFCDTFGAANTCIDSTKKYPPPGVDSEDDVLSVINANRRPEWLPLTQVNYLGSNSSQAGELSGTWEFPEPVNFVSAKADTQFKVFEFFDGATSGIWDTYGITNPVGTAQHELSHLRFWAFSSDAPPQLVPLPGAALLFGSGLLALLGLARRNGAGDRN